MASFDFYEEARDLARLLRSESSEEHADNIVRAIEEGSTGTEIVMALHWEKWGEAPR